MKTKIFVAMAFAAGLSFSEIYAQTKPKEAKEQNDKKFDDTSLEKDTKFAVFAADAGMLEVKLGELAVEKGSSQEVKDLGQKMIDDHTKANNELKELAAKKNISLPTALSDKSQKAYDKLSKLSGAEFDREYAQQMVKDHKMVVEAFENEAEKGNDSELKSWASGKVAALKHHLEMSKKTEDAVKDKK